MTTLKGDTMGCSITDLKTLLETTIKTMPNLGIRLGIERECLRLNPDGSLSTHDHYEGLGSALTNPYITTDYAENLLELITAPRGSITDLLNELKAIHSYTALNIGNEFLWAGSMPSHIPNDDAITIAKYGSSNTGKLKSLYRMGLKKRYSSTMQVIAGIHFNFSVGDKLLAVLKDIKGIEDQFSHFKSETYLGLARNIQRYGWLTTYLYGASPFIDKSFIDARGLKTNLVPFDDKGTLHYPGACSLRMSNLGYQNSTQGEIALLYNTIESYTESLLQAVKTPHKEWEDLGLYDSNGERQQLNTNLIQIENEFYNQIRPKRSILPGERPTDALKDRGVEYIEYRAVDINPFEPMGLSREQIEFFTMFLLYGLIKKSPISTEEEFKLSRDNISTVATGGRNPETRVHHNGELLSIKEAGTLILEEMRPVAEILNQAAGNTNFTNTLNRELERLKHPELTLSGVLEQTLRDRNISYLEYMTELSMAHTAELKSGPIDERLFCKLSFEAKNSLCKQKDIESKDTLNFEQYLNQYLNA